MASIEIKFAGEIVLDDNKISMRTLGKTLTHLQCAIDRAYLDISKGGVKKHQRMPSAEFDNALFFIGDIREGSFILDLLSNAPNDIDILKRITKALDDVIDRDIEEGEQRARKYSNQVKNWKESIDNNLVEPDHYSKLQLEIDPAIEREYSDKSIVKEINQILSIIRSNESGESYFDLKFIGDEIKKYSFDRKKSKKFNDVISDTNLGKPIIYRGKLRSLDVDTKRGKFTNYDSKRTSILRIEDDADIVTLRPLLGEKEIHFIGSPVVEYGSHDHEAGDIFFLRLVEQNELN